MRNFNLKKKLEFQMLSQLLLFFRCFTCEVKSKIDFHLFFRAESGPIWKLE
jgi:hypothetical protein